jgi:parallel beta-helix repeat protein
MLLGCQLELPEVDPGPGGDYFVDASGGDDDNPGTAARPWRTITKVNARTFAPGDRILLRRGETWAESLVPPSSGASGAPILFGAYGSGDRPRITGGAGTSCVHWTQPRSHLVFQDLHLRCEEYGLNVWSDPDRSTDVVIEGCVMEGAKSAGLYISGMSSVVIRGNTVRNSLTGLSIDGSVGMNSVVVEENDIHDNTDMCIHLSNASGVILRRNRIHDCKAGGLNNVGAKALLAHHNLLYGAMAGIYDVCEPGLYCASGGIYHHNTIAVGGGWTTCLSTGGNANFAEFRNNICVHSGEKGPLIGNLQATGRSDCNLFFAQKGLRFAWGGTTYGSFSDYQSGSGQDGLSEHADPLFLSPSTQDFHLTAGSLAVDHCPPLGYTVDLDGNPTPAGAGADAGAFERQ